MDVRTCRLRLRVPLSLEHRGGSGERRPIPQGSPPRSGATIRPPGEAQDGDQRPRSPRRVGAEPSGGSAPTGTTPSAPAGRNRAEPAARTATGPSGETGQPGARCRRARKAQRGIRGRNEKTDPSLERRIFGGTATRRESRTASRGSTPGADLLSLRLQTQTAQRVDHARRGQPFQSPDRHLVRVLGGARTGTRARLSPAARCFRRRHLPRRPRLFF